MLSIQAVRGLPRLHAPAVVPCIISLSPGNSLRRVDPMYGDRIVAI